MKQFTLQAKTSFLARGRNRRDGLSIMEVLFAIGVLMVGLLGIASILPVAGRNAANALRSDATAGAVENQINNAAARVTEQLTSVDVPNQSLASFQGNYTFPSAPGQGPYSGLSPLTPGYHVTRGFGLSYFRVDLSAPPIVKQRVVAESGIPGSIGLPVSGYRDLNYSALPPAPVVGPPSPDNDWLFDPIDAQFDSAPLPRPAFCIDPSFLTSADNTRDDNGAPGSRAINGYDRTMFPCYDLNYNPQLTPGLQMNAGNAFAMTPRMYRVAMPTTGFTAPSNAVARAMFSERDVLPLIRPDGELRDSPPGLLVRPTGATVGPTTQLSTSRFSTMIMLAPTSMGGRDYDAHIVVFDARQTTINPPGTVAANSVFNLQPYTTSLWADETALDESRTYGEEVLGIVEAAPSPISGGVGVFTYVHSAACNPDIGVNDWILLCRWLPEQAINRYAWYRVSDVLDGPDLDTSGAAPLYRTTIEVRGADWLFHPSQVVTSGASAGNATGFVYTLPGGALNNAYNRRVTTIVKMPSVVGVRTMNVTF